MCYHFCGFFLNYNWRKNQWLHLTPSSAIFFDLRSFDFLILHCKPTADGNHLLFCWKLKKKTHLKWPLEWLYEEGEDLAYPCRRKRTPEVLCWPWLEALMKFHLQNLNAGSKHISSEPEQRHLITSAARGVDSCTFPAARTIFGDFFFSCVSELEVLLLDWFCCCKDYNAIY